MTIKGLIAYANSAPSILRNCQNFEKVSSLKVFIGLADEVHSLQERGRKIIQRTFETSDNVAYSPGYWRLAEINFPRRCYFSYLCLCKFTTSFTRRCFLQVGINLSVSNQNVAVIYESQNSS